uniref:Retrovirus-related Pol polyprotein from transposon 297 n=1 Tax=Bactrocera latifrons TaxID=174628 RepID=A0A0K8UP46_BACLA
MNEMLRQGIIKESNSSYNSPLLIVSKNQDNSRKKKWRTVIDYRKLNEVTIDDKFPIPHIETILSKLGKAQYFTTIDLAKGFHQVLIKEEDRPKTASSTPQGHFEFIRMPFRLKNAPATFQRLMNSVLREYINKIFEVYLDILIFSVQVLKNIPKISTKYFQH